MPPKQFLVVYPDTYGNAHDADVLSASLKQAFPDCSVASLPMRAHLYADYRSDVSALCPSPKGGTYDALFLIEHARLNPPFFNPGFARRIIYVPHVEWVMPVDEENLSLGLIDTVLAKNDYTRSILETLPCMKKVKRVVISGWTSRDPGLSCDPWNVARFDRFLHARGVSHLKQTDVVVETWRRHPEWPQLLVTAYTRDPISFAEPLSYGPNISVILRRQTAEELTALLESHGVHIMPSRAESFGHALNEARSVGALLVTTDAPPMNNLVEPGRTGVLVKAERAMGEPHFRSKMFPVKPADFETAISSVLDMPLPQRVEMGRRARTAFEVERAAFHRAIASLEL